MQASTPEQMRAAGIEKDGGPQGVYPPPLPVPRAGGGPGAHPARGARGGGVWDADVGSGEYEIGERRFPKVIGNDGAGEIVAVGSRVKRRRPGERVYAYSMEGGFYAEYVAVDQASTAEVPPGLSIERAG